MTIFLFLKQVVDMFYEHIWLDVVMSAALVVLIISQTLRLMPEKVDMSNIKRIVKLPDICLACVTVILVCHMVFEAGRKDYGFIIKDAKLVTAILMYVLGRIAYERIFEGTKALAISAYIVIYTNVCIRIVSYGLSNFFDITQAYNGIYYYGTDLSFAVLMAMIFVGMYGRNSLLKFLTLFLVCPFMIISSKASVQIILMVVTYVLLFMFMAERAVKRRRFTDFILPSAIVVLLLIITVLYIPGLSGSSEGMLINAFEAMNISMKDFITRYDKWNDVFNRLSTANWGELLFGISVNDSEGIASEYLGMLYSIGIIGLVFASMFILSIAGCAVKIYDRKTYYVTVMLAILFLGTSINVRSMMFTQISWLPLLYAGMAVSAGDRTSNRGNLEKVNE